MTNHEIIQYYDYLIRLAVSKCNSQTDAEDLVGETMLAAFAYLHRGGTIKHPKTWLVNTLYHKHNDNLRKKYHSPVTVCLDEGFNISDEENEEYLTSEEASKLRKELNHLAYITREVLIRFYYGDQSIEEIARGLNIPEGTVKSRLYAGRTQIKKGLKDMESKENHLPGQLYLSFGGTMGAKGEPMSLTDNDLIAQNLLILAYEKPLTVSELSKAIGIPAAYIEPILEKLIYNELMVQTDSGKVYTDFIITKPQSILENFKPQLEFAHKHFDTVWAILKIMSDNISDMAFVRSMTNEKRTKLNRFAVLKSLQDFQYYSTDRIKTPDFPQRKDGGCWFAQATAFDAGYNMEKYLNATEYVIHGGHRISHELSVGRAKEIWFHEFDTTLQDTPQRYGGVFDLYFRYIIPLLWHIYDDIPLEKSEIPNEFISYIPTLETVGLLGHTENKLCIEIPVLKKSEYDMLSTVINRATEEIKTAIGEKFALFIRSMKTPLPRHLTSVPELYRYREATTFFVMAIVREAYNKGLHLKDVDYCCPPAVLVWD